MKQAPFIYIILYVIFLNILGVQGKMQDLVIHDEHLVLILEEVLVNLIQRG